MAEASAVVDEVHVPGLQSIPVHLGQRGGDDPACAGQPAHERELAAVALPREPGFVAMADRCRRDDASVAALRDAFDALLPAAHRRFLRSTELSYRCGNHSFAHAGVRPGVPLGRPAARDLRWIRSPFLDSTLDHGAVVLHGHSIAECPQLRPNRIGIDTGAYRSGVLTCLVLDGPSRHFLHTG
ncbi:MAG: hypothetical protein U5L05_19050 [Rubrivivax sp.]|nr:hypothetical protein [Rubrivivax sp.]